MSRGSEGIPSINQKQSHRLPSRKEPTKNRYALMITGTTRLFLGRLSKQHLDYFLPLSILWLFRRLSIDGFRLLKKKNRRQSSFVFQGDKVISFKSNSRLRTNFPQSWRRIKEPDLWKMAGSTMMATEFTNQWFWRLATWKEKDEAARNVAWKESRQKQGRPTRNSRVKRRGLHASTNLNDIASSDSWLHKAQTKLGSFFSFQESTSTSRPDCLSLWFDSKKNKLSFLFEKFS